jgi:hypothetical protein
VWGRQRCLVGRTGRGAASLVTFLHSTMGTTMKTTSAFTLHSAMPGNVAHVTRLAIRVVLTSKKVILHARVRTCVRMWCVLHVDKLVCSAAQMG